MHNYSESINFPNIVQEFDDSDPPAAAFLNTAAEGALDRTAFFATRLLPGGVTPFASTTVPSTLNAIVGAVDLETREIAGYGLYILRTASTKHVDGTYCVYQNGVTGSNPGRWLRVNYAMPDVSIVYQGTAQFLGANVGFSVAAKDAPDPAGRAGGTPGFRVATLTPGSPITTVVGDLIVASYGFDWALTGGQQSDLVTGVWYDDGGAGGIPADSICAIGSTTGAFYPNGVTYSPSENSTFNISRTSQFRVNSADTYNRFALIGCYDGHSPGNYFQGCSLTVTVYRSTL